MSTVVRMENPGLVGLLDGSAAWQELWPLDACGLPRDVIVLFAPLKGQPGQFWTGVAPHWNGK